MACDTNIQRLLDFCTLQQLCVNNGPQNGERDEFDKFMWVLSAFCHVIEAEIGGVIPRLYNEYFPEVPSQLLEEARTRGTELLQILDIEKQQIQRTQGGLPVRVINSDMPGLSSALSILNSQHPGEVLRNSNLDYVYTELGKVFIRHREDLPGVISAYWEEQKPAFVELARRQLMSCTEIKKLVCVND